MTSAASPSASPEQRRALALQRLEQSRSALILALSPEPPDRFASADGSTAGASDHGPASWLSALASRVERKGFVRGVARTLQTFARRWWKRQPWHSSVDLVVSTAAHEVRPVVQRHPWASLAVGAALGAFVIAVARPLFWRPLQQQLESGRHHLGSMMWSQFNQVPVQMALAGALAAWINDLSQKSRAAAERPAAAPASPATPVSTPPPPA